MPYQPWSSVAARIESFEKKPANGKIPTSASDPTRNAVRVHGISSPMPPMRRMSCSPVRSEEHTSELQSHSDLVCRLLLEKKKKKKIHIPTIKKTKINKTKRN